MTDFQEISKDDKTPAPISLGLGVYLCNFLAVKHRLKF